MNEIILKYLEGTATDAEKAELLVWLRKKENRKQFNFQKSVWKSGQEKDSFPGGGQKTWTKIQSDMLERSFEGWQKSGKTQQLLRYAAIFFFLTTLGTLIWISNRSSLPPELSTKVIADGGYISKVVLPDGSLVWLNSGSTLSYNNGFAFHDRIVKLSGEAYFDIRKNKDIPFRVMCNELEVKVTGTKFNVNAFPGTDKIRIVLEEGAVELLNKNNTSSGYHMKPGQLAECNVSDMKVKVSEINTYKYTSWKEGVINIYDQTLEEVAERLKFRYNQEFVVSDEVKNYHYTFTVKNEPLNEIIGLIEKITPVKAVQEGAVINFLPDRNKIKRMDK